MVLKFYYHSQSPPGQAVWMVLKELGIEYEEVVIDVFKNENNTEKYKAVNPYGKVPAIVDGDLKLAESRAICIYLCSKYEEKQKKNKLYPKDVVETAKMNMGLFHGIDTNNAVMKYMNGEAIFIGKASGPLEEALPKALAVFAEMDKTLAEKDYLGGDHLTLLDFFALTSIGIMAMTGFDGWSDYPNIQRWKRTLAELPYFEETHEKPVQKSAGFFAMLSQKAAASLGQSKKNSV